MQQDAWIKPENKLLIQRFVTFCGAANLSVERQLIHLQKLTVLARLHPPTFEQATKESILDLMDRVKKRDVAEWTYQMYCVALKKFCRWLRGTDDYPPEVRWLKASVRNKANVTADKLLSEPEVLKLAEVAENHRDRAFVLVLYESGCRIGEILGLRIRDLAYDENGALLSETHFPSGLHSRTAYAKILPKRQSRGEHRAAAFLASYWNYHHYTPHDVYLRGEL